MAAGPDAAAHAAHRPIVHALPADSRSNRFVTSTTAALRDLGCAVDQLNWMKIGRERVDVILLHWPNDFFRDKALGNNLKKLARTAISKLRYGTKLVWIAHNLRPHEGGSERSGIVERLFFRLLDGIIFLSRASSEATTALYGPLPHVERLVTVHGRYDSARPTIDPPADSAAVRLLHFGRVRPYKNVEALIDAVRASADQGVRLTVVGLCEDASYRAALAARAAGDPRVTLDLRDGPLSDREIEDAIDACDGVILPYKAVLNSGAAFHALSRRRPVLVPAMGSLPELAADVGEAWVRLYQDMLDDNAIEGFAKDLRGRAPGAAPELSAYGWDRVTEDIGGFFQRIGVAGFGPIDRDRHGA